MPDSSPQDLVSRIHASGKRLVVSVTGGGSQSIADLVTVPGASASLLEARVPYAQTALEEWLGGRIDQACSESTARAMAMAGFERARSLTTETPQALRGIGATASLTTSRPKHGPHRIHVAWQSANATVAYSCELVKGRRTRLEEEAVAAGLVLHAVAEACSIANAPYPQVSADEPITRREKVASTEWTELLLGERTSVYKAGKATASPESPRVLFPGAFNPLHAGHRRMAELAAARCGGPVVLELSITNVDKPPLDFLEIDDRLRHLTEFPVLLSRASTFAEKAAIVPGATFVVGADTIGRIGDANYYGADVGRRDAAIETIASYGCRFLVFGRLFPDGFLTLAQLSLRAALLALCEEVPEADFRDDISSTALRREP